MPCQWKPIPPRPKTCWNVSFRHVKACGWGETTAQTPGKALFNVVLRYARDRREAVFIVADLNKGLGQYTIK
jgi:hypothetical protein